MSEIETADQRASLHKALDEWIDKGDGDLVFRKDGNEQPAPPPPPMPVAKSMPASSKHTDAYDKLVPAALRDKKTGLNIAIIADFNIAGRMTELMRLLNRHSIHRARCIIANDDYLAYDRDVVLQQGHDPNEVTAIVEEADLYHFGRCTPPIPTVDWAARLTRNNCLVQYFGSEIRHLGREIVAMHDKTGIIGLSAWDYTMLQPHPLFYHVNTFFDASSVRPCDHAESVVRICHATTNRPFKKSDVIRAALERVAARFGDKVEVVLIEGKSNRECLEIKQRCHITVDQISSGIYGLSAIESMAMGHVVLCGMSNFALSYYPDCPVVPVQDENGIVDVLTHLVVNSRLREAIGEAGRAFVKRTVDPLRVLEQHCWIYDMVVSGHRLLNATDGHLLDTRQQ